MGLRLSDRQYEEQLQGVLFINASFNYVPFLMVLIIRLKICKISYITIMKRGMFSFGEG